ncbi:hypothetical protein CRENBAI_023662 [Crenichthys baileyi]|uniref:Protein SPT2 homolog n=1 Tax=Crenichthys baileyi TaxID=28760 RepID=A0AAV9RPK2_9TELE
MMDFDNILDIASQNQGVSSVQRRYSLQAGPSKKDPKSKGVNPAAVQALLNKRHNDTKQKELEVKKQKEQLLAKRVELKSDRKARAMASRTKDNFKGYNGIPVVEAPKKRGSKVDKQDHSNDSERFRNDAINPLDDEDNYEYEQTDSEAEPEPEVLRPGKTVAVSRTSGTSKTVSKQLAGPPKPPPAMNFADLLRLAEKKQFEPVELKPKVKKEERLRTAEEIRELEMERKAKRPDKNRDSKVDGGREGSRSLSSSSSVRKNTTDKEQKHNRPQKNSIEDTSLHRSGNKVQPTVTSDRGLSFSKPVSDKDRDRNKVPHSHGERSKMGMSATSAATVSKNPSKALSSQVSAKQASSRPSFTQKPSTSSDLSLRKDKLSLHQKGASGIPRNRPSSVVGASQKSQQGSLQQTRPIQGSSLKQLPIAGGMKSSTGHLQRPGNNSVVGSNGKSLMRPSLGGPSKAGNQSQGRPVSIPQNKPGGAPQARLGGSGPGRGGSRPPGSGPFNPGSGGQVPGRPNGSLGSGPGRPKCTVVSETISSKNVGGPRPGVSVRPGMQQRPGMIPGMRPGMPARPMMNRPPGTTLPPITIAYKRKYEDEEEEEYDPEMDDFIDDGDEEQEEISRHIKEIFGYDRTRYKDESDYALKFMESSWKDLQKEEARSLRMAVQEDLEEERREEEELKRQKTKRKKIN